jgi:methionine-S-sulfoxide reductase
MIHREESGLSLHPIDMNRRNLLLAAAAILVVTICIVAKPFTPATKASGKTETALFAAGCFWHVQDTFDAVKGVKQTTVGYTGGHTLNPTYRQVCTDATGHAEAVKVEYDPEQVSYVELLDVFFRGHDPTTADHQGPDYGTQYRSAIFYLNEEQRRAAEAKKAQLSAKVVTEIKPAGQFFQAEEYHQHYDRKNGLFSLF